MRFHLTLLGTSSAVPLPNRFTTAQLLDVEGRLFLFDCGEGVQVRLQQFGFRSHRIEHIFISHLHGDHILGLVGLLNSMSLQQRSRPLSLHGPAGLKKILEVFSELTSSQYDFLDFVHPVDTTRPSIVMKDQQLTVEAIPLSHRLPTVGYLLKEKVRPRNMRPEVIAAHNLDTHQIIALKAGEDIILPSGVQLSAEEATQEAVPPRSYAFITDTQYLPDLQHKLAGVDLLYHEATFCDEHLALANATLHSTASQAASLAFASKANWLLLGHYSIRYKDLDCFAREARAIFPNTLIGQDGMQIQVHPAGKDPVVKSLLH